MPRTPLLFAIALSIASGGVHAAPPTPVIVELFTSEGCSDCPPADTLLEKLIATQPIAGVEIIGLGQHVDYWDRLGWKDRFSSAALTNRQQTYQTRFNTSSLYTPQMVVDGRAEFVGSDASAARRAIDRATALPHGAVRVTIESDEARGNPGASGRARGNPDVARGDPDVARGNPDVARGNPDVARGFQPRDRGPALRQAQGTASTSKGESAALQVSVTVSDLPRLGRGDRADVIVAVTESGLRTDVKRGENHGRTLSHAAVVRHMATIGHVASDGSTSASAQADIPLAADWQRDHLTIVAFVQELRGRTILASASVPLKNARP